MPDGQVLEFTQVTKRFGDVTAVSDLSVRVEPGVVTGFLGPNGAGKTTSLRILLGQIRPTSGTATIGGSPYSELRQPLRTVGAVLEESAYRPRRSAARHLTIAAKANGIPAERVEEVLHLVGLQDDADTRLGSYSLGMRQRLAVAHALLGDPGVLVLDEPANGLDPEGIRWMRLLMRRLADEGRTVLVSSHVLSEIEQVADNVVVLSRGRAVYSGSISELADPAGGAVVVDADDRMALVAALTAAGLSFDLLRSGVTVRDSDAARVGAVAAEAGVALSMLQQRGPSLEEVFLDLVYGRRTDSPRLDEVANPVAHAESSDAATGTAADAAFVAGGLPLAGAAAVAADGGAVAAAGVGYGTSPIDIVASADEPEADEASDASDAEDASEVSDAQDAEADASDAEADVSDAEADVAQTETETEVDEANVEPADSEPQESEQQDSEQQDSEQQDSEPWEFEAPTAEAPTTDDGDDARPDVLPLATEAVSIPAASSDITFTGLITGIPAGTDEVEAPATAAIPIPSITPRDEDDEDSTVDDAEHDPRLAAMRTSLSSAASRFFEGPAPEYPYSPSISYGATSAEDAAAETARQQPEHHEDDIHAKTEHSHAEEHTADGDHPHVDEQPHVDEHHEGEQPRNDEHHEDEHPRNDEHHEDEHRQHHDGTDHHG